MTFRKFATGAALTIAGLLAAVGIGLLANSISGDNVGLSAKPLSAGETLAPSTADRAKARAKQHAAALVRGQSAPPSDHILRLVLPDVEDPGSDSGALGRVEQPVEVTCKVAADPAGDPKRVIAELIQLGGGFCRFPLVAEPQL